ncbi:21041_t:CDS:2, partial [Rhizophagus irregularis]
ERPIEKGLGWVIINTNSEIEALIRALRDIQEEIIELRDKNRRLGNIKTDDWNKREESSIKEIQEEIVKIETTI